eukprot:gene7437-11760_t
MNCHHSIFTTFKLHPSDVEEFINTSAKVSQMSKKETGCLNFSLCVNNKGTENQIFFLTETFKTTKDYEYHIKQSYTVEFENVKKKCLKTPQVDICLPTTFLLDIKKFENDQIIYLKDLAAFIKENTSILFSIKSWNALFNQPEAKFLQQVFNVPILLLEKMIIMDDQKKAIGTELSKKLDIFFMATFYICKGYLEIYDTQPKSSVFFEDELRKELKRNREETSKSSTSRSKKTSNEQDTFIRINRELLNVCVASWRDNSSKNLVPKGCHLYNQYNNKKKRDFHPNERYFICISQNPTELEKELKDCGDAIKIDTKKTYCAEVNCGSKLIYNCFCGAWKTTLTHQIYNHDCPFDFELKIQKINPNSKFLGFNVKRILGKNEKMKCLGYTFYASWRKNRKLHKLIFINEEDNIPSSEFVSMKNEKEFFITIWCQHSHSDTPVPFFHSQLFNVVGDTIYSTKSNLGPLSDELIDILLYHLEVQLKECSHRFVLFLYCCYIGISIEKMNQIFGISKQELLGFEDDDKRGNGKNGIFWYIFLSDSSKQEFDTNNLKDQLIHLDFYESVDKELFKLKLFELITNFRYGSNNTIFDEIQSDFF